jgi:catechol 2,3-dioxygenase-like lactoylglutathione lyase family enzyme
MRWWSEWYMASQKLAFRAKVLTIACTDLKKSERFYKTVLGAQVMPTDDGIGCPWYRLGPLAITLMPNATERSPATLPTHAMPILWLEVDDLAAAAERFVRHKVEVVDPGDGQFMMVADPDGLIIEVWQAEDGADDGTA